MKIFEIVTEGKKEKSTTNESLKALAKHVKEGVPLVDSLFRYQSEAYFDTFRKAKQLREAGSLPELDWESEEMLGTDIGESVEIKGVGRVWLDVPYLYEDDEEEDHQFFFVTVGTGRDSMVVKTRAKNRREAIKSQKMKYPDKSVRIKPEENPHLEEAEYQGKEVELNKPKRGGSKKYYVYVKNPKTGNIKKISFGDPGLKTKSGNKGRAKSFAARHNCEKKNDKTKAGYWACRLPRYGLVKGGKWW